MIRPKNGLEHIKCISNIIMALKVMDLTNYLIYSAIHRGISLPNRESIQRAIDNSQSVRTEGENYFHGFTPSLLPYSSNWRYINLSVDSSGARVIG